MFDDTFVKQQICWVSLGKLVGKAHGFPADFDLLTGAGNITGCCSTGICRVSLCKLVGKANGFPADFDLVTGAGIAIIRSQVGSQGRGLSAVAVSVAKVARSVTGFHLAFFVAHSPILTATQCNLESKYLQVSHS